MPPSPSKAVSKAGANRRQLGVNFVLHGSVRKVGDRIAYGDAGRRQDVQDRVVQRYDRSDEDVFGVQDE